MARTLVLLDTWCTMFELPIELERAMLIDFSLEHPRFLISLVPEIGPVIRAHDLGKHDLGDLFAQQTFNSLRERFSTIVSNLIARDLATEIMPTAEDKAFMLRPTPLGQDIAKKLVSSVSIGYRAMCTVLCQAWKSKNLTALATDLRKSLPDESIARARLTEPFSPWVLGLDSND